MQVIKQFSTLNIAVMVLLAFCLTSGNAIAGDEDVTVMKSEGGFLGIYPDDIDDDDREALDYDKKGILVEDVVPDGPAEKAGLESGDILIKLGKNEIASIKDLREALRKHKANEKVKVKLIRDRKAEEMKVVLGERPAGHIAMASKMKNFHRQKTLKMKKGGFLGVNGSTLNEQLAEYFGVKEGVLIETVEEGSPADQAGIKAGDVIVRVEKDEIESFDDLVDAIRSHEPESEVAIQIVRKGKNQTIKARLGETEWSDAGRMFSKSMHIYRDDDDGDILFDYDFDFDELGDHLSEVFKDIDIEISAGAEELKEDMEELRKEMQKLKKELQEMKK